MSTQWTSGATSPIAAAFGLTQEEYENETGVLLLYGKNSFGDKVYSYLEITIPNLRKLKDASVSGKGFNPSDFGKVIAAGRGEPSDEVRAEISSTYQVMNNRGEPQKPAAPSAPIPTEKKGWDEY